MENDDDQNVPEDRGDAQPARPAWIPVAVVVGSAVLGAATGGVLVGPMLAGGAAAETGEAHGSASPALGEGHEPPPVGEVVELENVIVNPAGSQGLRYVMATIAIEVHDAATVEELRERAFQLKDRIISVLETQTLDEVTAPGARDRLRALLREVIAPFLEAGTEFRVYLPHFVIQ